MQKGVVGPEFQVVLLAADHVITQAILLGIAGAGIEVPSLAFKGGSLEVSLMQAGAPVIDATVTAVFYMPAMPSMSMPEMRSTFPLQAAGDGIYRGTGNLSMGGTWNVTVTASRTGETLGRGKYTIIAD